MLAVIGDIVQDIVVWQREKVRPATDTASDIFIQRGGSAANADPLHRLRGRRPGRARPDQGAGEPRR